jgi:hypothetical protein
MAAAMLAAVAADCAAMSAAGALGLVRKEARALGPVQGEAPVRHVAVEQAGADHHRDQGDQRQYDPPARDARSRSGRR